MPETPVSFSVQEPEGVITLEGQLFVPETDGPAPGVVVCHPHPLYGGAMGNNVVEAICGKLQARGLATLRFNFRGVGSSQGAHGQGVDELRDAGAALACLEQQAGVAPARIGLAGYSFGSRVSLQTAGADPRVQAVAMIALPTSRLDTTTALDDYQKPKFFISGGRDDVSNTDALRAYVDHLPEPRTLQVVEGIDHFWLGAESAMADAVADFFADSL